MINVNLAGFGQSWRAWMLEQSRIVLAVYRGLAAEMMTYMIHETPQYTGESVSNWALSAGAPMFSTHTGWKEAYEASAPRGMRSPYNKASGGGRGPNAAAMDDALARMHSGLAGVKSITDTIYITNATAWDASADVSDIVQGQPRWLRPQNRASMAPIEAQSYVLARYSGVLDAMKMSHLMKMAT